MTAMILPAAQGCWLLTYQGDYDPGYTKVPVIAWIINKDPPKLDDWEDNWEDYATVRPITTKGERYRRDYDWAMLHYDGTVTRSDALPTWDGVKEWVEDRKRIARSKAEAKAKKAQEQATLAPEAEM